MPTKDEIVRDLIDWHAKLDPEMTKAYRFLVPNEDDPREPIKLLEVSYSTPASGSVMPFAFGPTAEVPFASVIATVTPEEMEQIERQEISLPGNWSKAERQDYTPHPTPSSPSQDGAE